MTISKFVCNDCWVHLVYFESDEAFYVHAFNGLFCNGVRFDNLADAIDYYCQEVQRLVKDIELIAFPSEMER